MNQNASQTNTNNTPLGVYRPRLSFYHPNAKCTGCAVKFALHPAHDNVDGSIWLSVANQKSVGDRRGPNPTFARFDWENSINVKLDFSDLCKILQVLRGECESIDDGHGLYHKSVRAATRIVFRHNVEPVQGYSLELYRVPAGDGVEQRAHIMFTSAEALGLCEAISSALYLVGFGIPMLVAHDTSAYEQETKEARRADVA